MRWELVLCWLLAPSSQQTPSEKLGCGPARLCRGLGHHGELPLCQGPTRALGAEPGPAGHSNPSCSSLSWPRLRCRECFPVPLAEAHTGTCPVCLHPSPVPVSAAGQLCTQECRSLRSQCCPEVPSVISPNLGWNFPLLRLPFV